MRGDDLQQDAMFSYVSPDDEYRLIIHCGPFAGWWTRC